ncbi:MAG: lipopolysaccharide heptosyltransferase II [Planctomycetes bacterium]|nr:lipopolysaccharide heptosyltransferase II [Planctomycetota bacterium]
MGQIEHEPERACVRAPNWVGDVVMATPAFRALRSGLPKAHISLVVRRRVAPVLRGAPWFDQVITYDPEGRWAPGEFVRCARALRTPRRELGLLLPNSLSSALMFRLAGVRRRVGYKRDCRSVLLTDAVPRPSEGGRFKPTYMVDYYLRLCERAGLEVAGRRMELFFSDEDAGRAQQVLRRQGVAPDESLHLLHPGAGYGPSKRWPAERFARLAGMLSSEFGAKVAVIGGPAEQAAARAIQRRSSGEVTNLIDCGIDLHLLKCVVARSGLLVTTDSGPRHYGVALGVPTVCVMGPTHPAYSTSDLPNDRVVRLDVECGPCQRKVCPLDHRCMEDISARMVFDACAEAIAAGC